MLEDSAPELREVEKEEAALLLRVLPATAVAEVLFSFHTLFTALANFAPPTLLRVAGLSTG